MVLVGKLLVVLRRMEHSKVEWYDQTLESNRPVRPNVKYDGSNPSYAPVVLVLQAASSNQVKEPKLRLKK